MKGCGYEEIEFFVDIEMFLVTFFDWMQRSKNVTFCVCWVGLVNGSMHLRNGQIVNLLLAYFALGNT